MNGRHRLAGLRGSIDRIELGMPSIAVYLIAPVVGGVLAVNLLLGAQYKASLSAEYRLEHPVLQPNSLIQPIDKRTQLGSDYYPPDLVDLGGISFPGHQVRELILPDLAAMLEAAKTDGVHLKIISGYRSYQTQRDLFSRYARKYGVIGANTFSALPGQSEHQLGTAIDFGNGRSADLTPEFANQEEGQWLAQHAYEYGFILSYPINKESVTGYVFEPWHYRYVGRENALILHQTGLTLQEQQTANLDDLIRLIRRWQWGLGWRESLLEL